MIDVDHSVISKFLDLVKSGTVRVSCDFSKPDSISSFLNDLPAINSVIETLTSTRSSSIDSSDFHLAAKLDSAIYELRAHILRHRFAKHDEDTSYLSSSKASIDSQLRNAVKKCSSTARNLNKTLYESEKNRLLAKQHCELSTLKAQHASDFCKHNFKPSDVLQTMTASLRSLMKSGNIKDAAKLQEDHGRVEQSEKELWKSEITERHYREVQELVDLHNIELADFEQKMGHLLAPDFSRSQNLSNSQSFSTQTSTSLSSQDGLYLIDTPCSPTFKHSTSTLYKNSQTSTLGLTQSGKVNVSALYPNGVDMITLDTRKPSNSVLQSVGVDVLNRQRAKLSGVDSIIDGVVDLSVAKHEGNIEILAGSVKASRRASERRTLSELKKSYENSLRPYMKVRADQLY
ncbi:hypothetical protein RCL1_002212 [Eukaryota sp. TZLM3-RCL]